MPAIVNPSPPSVSVQPSDETYLIQQAQRSPAAFAELYRRHLDSVYRYLLAKVGNVQDAEDLTSQTFLEALENLSRYRGSGAFRAWLFRIARNKAVDHFRRRPALATDEAMEGVTDSAESPDDLAHHALAIAQISAKLRILSPDRAEAVSLRLFGQLEAAEIADIMHKPESAVRMLIHRGIHDLQAQLSPTPQEK